MVSGAGFTSYKIQNDVAFNAALDKARAQVNDLRLVFRLIAADFYKSQRSIFKLKSAGQYPDFGGFHPFVRVSKNGPQRREAYKLRKFKKLGFDYPLLVGKTGALRDASSVKDAPGNITLIGKQSLVIGVSDAAIPYAKFHQSDRPRKILPLRKFLFIGPEAPKFASSDQKGRLERWLNIISDNLPVLIQRQSGLGNTI